MCGWGPYAREASVWEAYCWYSGVINMFLNCLTPAHAPTNPAGVLLHGLRGAVVRILRPRCQHAALENEGADKMDY